MAELDRFVDAQDSADTYTRALAELRDGRKRTHWMWFVFPQIAGLASSPVARHFAVADIAEAEEYAAHPVLGPRLVEACVALTALPGDDPVAVLGSVDAMKLRSSMTLFAAAQPDEPAFAAVLAQYFDGLRDEATTQRL